MGWRHAGENPFANCESLGAELEELLAGALSGRSLDSLDIDSESPMRRSPRFVSNVAGRT